MGYTPNMAIYLMGDDDLNQGAPNVQTNPYWCSLMFIEVDVSFVIAVINNLLTYSFLFKNIPPKEKSINHRPSSLIINESSKVTIFPGKKTASGFSEEFPRRSRNELVMDIDRLLEPLGFLRDIRPNRLYGQLRDVPRLMFGGFMTLKSKKNYGFLGGVEY